MKQLTTYPRKKQRKWAFFEGLHSTRPFLFNDINDNNVINPHQDSLKYFFPICRQKT